MDDRNRFVDAKGFIGHRQENGELEFGDGMNRLAMFYFGVWLCAQTDNNKRLAYLDFTEREYQIWAIGLEEPRRHWDDTKWWGQRGSVSADQIEPTLCFDLATGNLGDARGKLYQLRDREFFCWNTKRIWESSGWKVPDWAGIRFLAYYLRSFHPGILVSMWDMFLVPSVLWLCAIGVFNKHHTSNDLNMCARLMCFEYCQPTIFSKIAKWLYFMFRPKSGLRGTYSYDKCDNGPASAVCWYFEAPGAMRAPMFIGKLWEMALNRHS